GAGYAQEVAFAGQAFQAGVILRAELKIGVEPAAVMVVHRHVEAACPFGDCASYAPHAQYAQPAAPYLAPYQLPWAPALPGAIADKVYAFDDSPRRAQHKQP